jgi:hypothetical protein
MALTVRREPSCLTVVSIGSRPNLGRLRSARVSLVSVANLVAVLARVCDVARVAVVGVDAAQHATVSRHNIVDAHISRPAVAGAVSAAAHHFSVVLGIKVLDLHGAPAVELHNLVGRLESATTVDVRRAAALFESASGS